MTVIPKVKISQPHVEQIHAHLENALIQCAKTRKIATKAGFTEIFAYLEEIEYEVKTARQSLPPKQLNLPL